MLTFNENEIWNSVEQFTKAEYLGIFKANLDLVALQNTEETMMRGTNFKPGKQLGSHASHETGCDCKIQYPTLK